MTVLMVDDEPLTIQTLAKNIDWAHLDVSTPLLAFNAKQAKELFDNWVTLTPEQKNAVLTMVRTFNHK